MSLFLSMYLESIADMTEICIVFCIAYTESLVFDKGIKKQLETNQNQKLSSPL